MKPTFFPTFADWRAWLAKHHASEKELLVGFYKKSSGKPSITWPESVDGALCFGWIDGVRRRIDDESYTIRFTPRRPKSIWSNINIARVGELTKLGLMHEAGQKAFGGLDEKRAGIYLYERGETPEFDKALERRFRANKKAWAFFEAQPPGYRKIGAKYVMTAKREETRASRLETLIAESEAGRRIGLSPPARKPK